jgi:Domain of unknown function (DUF4410)
MKFRNRIVLTLCALVVIAGCASTKVTEQSQPTKLKLARPKHIWIYDFVATPNDKPANSDVAVEKERQTPEQIEAGRQLGAQIALELAAKLQEMGLPGYVATSTTAPQINDIVIRGYLVSIDQGSAAKRLTIGFGAGSSELTTVVEGYVMTSHGLHKLGFGHVESGGGKTPGAAVPAVVAIAAGNPVGLIVTSGMKIYGEASGSAKIQARAKSTADEIAEQLKVRAQAQGWISAANSFDGVRKKYQVAIGIEMKLAMV